MKTTAEDGKPPKLTTLHDAHLTMTALEKLLGARDENEPEYKLCEHLAILKDFSFDSHYMAGNKNGGKGASL